MSPRSKRKSSALSGGFRTLRGMEEAVASGVTDLIGLGRPLSSEPELPAKILAGTFSKARIADIDLALGKKWLAPSSENRRIRHLNSFADVGWHCTQIERMGDGKDVEWSLSPLAGMLKFFGGGFVRQFRRRHK